MQYKKILFIYNEKLCYFNVSEFKLYSFMYKKYKVIDLIYIKETIIDYFKLWIKKIIDYDFNNDDFKILGTVDDNYIKPDEIKYYIVIDDYHGIISYNPYKIINYYSILEDIIKDNNLIDHYDYDEEKEVNYEEILNIKNLYEGNNKEEDLENLDEENNLEEFNEESVDEESVDKELVDEYERYMEFYNNYHSSDYITKINVTIDNKIIFLKKLIKYYKNNNIISKDDKNTNINYYLVKLGTQYCRKYKYTNNNFEKITYNMKVKSCEDIEERLSSSYSKFTYKMIFTTLNEYRNVLNINVEKSFKYVDDGHDFYNSSSYPAIVKINPENSYICSFSKKQVKLLVEYVFSNVFDKDLYNDEIDSD